MESPQLILTVAGAQAQQFGSGAQMRFVHCGGSIGRSDDCDWVLSAPGVSRTHAVVRFLNGLYFIEDRSTNGMLLNGTALVRGEPAALKQGDTLQLDSFEIGVVLERDSVPQAGNDLLGGLDDRTQVAPPASVSQAGPDRAGPSARDLELLGLLSTPARDTSDDVPLAPSAGPELDPLRLLDPLPDAAQPPRADWNRGDALNDHFRPPAAASATLPENWDITSGDFSKSAAPAASRKASQAGGVELPPELQRIFAIVVDGVMEVLRARAEIKNTFRLPVTLIQRSENNPLKFAATPEEALQKLLAPPGPAFLSGTEAFEDAFDDIRCHQMAMLAGMRAAFESMLFHFSPERLQQETDAAGRRLSFGGKGRYWERYCENFEQLRKDPDECFRRLFGDEFARAYEAQLARLKSARR